MAAVVYEVGDIVTLKKGPSMRQQGLGNLKSRRRFPPEMSWAVDTRSWFRARWWRKTQKIFIKKEK